MKAGFVITLVAGLALLGSGASGGGTSTGKATLKLVRGAPLTLRGAHFRTDERVTVTVRSESQAAKRTTADDDGEFVVRFPGVAYDRCAGLAAVAVGSRGSRAVLKRPELLCPPRL